MISRSVAHSAKLVFNADAPDSSIASFWSGRARAEVSADGTRAAHVARGPLYRRTEEAYTAWIQLAAPTFLYKVVLRRPFAALPDILPASRPKRLPVVLSASEVRRVLARLREPDRLIVALLYGSGLRIHECVSLRIKDIDLDRREIVVRSGKGDKDRHVPLAESAIPDLKRALRHEKLG